MMLYNIFCKTSGDDDDGDLRPFCKAYLGIDSLACRSPCNKMNISQSLQTKINMRYSGDLERYMNIEDAKPMSPLNGA